MSDLQTIDDYIDYLESVKNYSEHTLLSYKNDLIEFLLSIPPLKITLKSL